MHEKRVNGEDTETSVANPALGTQTQPENRLAVGPAVGQPG